MVIARRPRTISLTRERGTLMTCPCFAFAPPEVDPPLIVNADTMLTASITVQGFKAVAWRDPKVVKPLCCVDDKDLALARRWIWSGILLSGSRRMLFFIDFAHEVLIIHQDPEKSGLLD